MTQLHIFSIKLNLTSDCLLISVFLPGFAWCEPKIVLKIKTKQFWVRKRLNQQTNSRQVSVYLKKTWSCLVSYEISCNSIGFEKFAKFIWNVKKIIMCVPVLQEHSRNFLLIKYCQKFSNILLQMKSQIKYKNNGDKNNEFPFKSSSPALTYAYKEISVKNQDICGKCTFSLC